MTHRRIVIVVRLWNHRTHHRPFQRPAPQLPLQHLSLRLLPCQSRHSTVPIGGIVGGLVGIAAASFETIIGDMVGPWLACDCQQVMSSLWIYTFASNLPLRFVEGMGPGLDNFITQRPSVANLINLFQVSTSSLPWPQCLLQRLLQWPNQESRMKEWQISPAAEWNNLHSVLAVLRSQIESSTHQLLQHPVVVVLSS